MKGERPELEAVTKELVKTEQAGDAPVRVVVN